MQSRLSTFITPQLISNKPEAQQIANAIMHIMRACDLAPTRDNFVNLIVPECIALAAKLDERQEHDIFSVSLDNQLKPLLRASMDLFPLSIEPAKRLATGDSGQADDEVKPEPNKGSDAADPAAGAQSSGPGPINYHINYVKFSSAADKLRKIEELAATAKKRREDEDRLRQSGLTRDYFLRLTHFVRENLKQKNAREQELMQLGTTIKTQYKAWNEASYLTREPVSAQLVNVIAIHSEKHAEYLRFIATLYNNGVMNSVFVKKYEFSSFRMQCEELSYVKSMVADTVASDARLKIALANPFSQEAMDIRLEGARYMAEVRQKKQQEALMQQQQQQTKPARQEYYRQVNYR